MATGFGLSNNGLNVSIFEGRDVVGGLGGSEVVDGMTFDYGPHIYHTHDSEMIYSFLKKLWRFAARERIFFKNHKGGVLYDYPLSYESIEKFPEDIKKVKKAII